MLKKWPVWAFLLLFIVTVFTVAVLGSSVFSAKDQSIDVTQIQAAPPPPVAPASPTIMPSVQLQPSVVVAKLPLKPPADTDLNHDGVPDRVNRFIEREFADSMATQRALTQAAQGWQQAITKVHDRQTAKRAGDEIAHAIDCVASPEILKKVGIDGVTMKERLMKARGAILDNQESVNAYAQFNQLASGQIFLDSGSKPCNFSTQDLVN